MKHNTTDYDFIEAALPQVINGVVIGSMYAVFLGKGAGRCKFNTPDAVAKIDTF